VPDLGAIDIRIRPLLKQMLEPDPAQRPESMAALAAWSPELTSSARRDRAPAAPIPGPIPDIGIQKSRRAMPRKYAAAGLVLIALLGAVGGAVYLVAFRSAKPGATPGLADKGSSSTSLAETGAPEKSGEASAAGRIKSYVAQYDGGNCFFLAPIGISDRAAVLEGFGSSIEPFKAFDAAFKRQIGFEANIGVRQITEQQCPAISFLSQLRGNNARIPHLDIEQEDLNSGSVLNGIVDSYGERQIALLLVSDSGTVQNVSNLLKPGMDSKNFALGLKRAEGVTGRKPQLLIAIATPSPIGVLQSGEPAKADQFFPTVLREAASAGTPIGATARYFSLEGGG
jgi:serine/threonine-protein kinase